MERKLASAIAYFKKNSFGISRRDMPQINSGDVPAFLRWLNTQHGITFKKKTIPAKQLNHTQGELNGGKAVGMMSNPEALKKPVIVSDDLYLLDGHHRHLAQFMISPNYPTPVYLLQGIGIEDLLEIAKTFHKVGAKELHETRIKTFSEWLRENEEVDDSSHDCSCGCGDCGK